MIESRAGSMILWDSRTVHCNSPPIQKNKITHRLIRLAAYVTMLPTELYPKENREELIMKRRKAVDKGLTTGHPFKMDHSEPPKPLDKKSEKKIANPLKNELSILTVEQEMLVHGR